MIRSLSRNILFPWALRAGADRLLRQYGGRRLLNVMYHGVVRNDSTWFSPRHLTEKAFDEHLAYLCKHFDVITVAEAFTMRAEGRVPKRHTITLSFDDGYANNVEVALPIIEKYRVPVTFFVLGPCAEPSGDRVSWSDLIAALGRTTPDRAVRALGRTYMKQVEVESGAHLMDDMKKAPPPERDEALRQLDQEHGLRKHLEGVDPHVWKFMGPDQLLSLSASSFVEIGSHAYAHYNLGLIPLEQAVQDMSRSKEALEGLLGRPVQSIAYPEGSYSPAVKDAAEKLGFKRQLAVNFRCADDPGDQRIQARHGVPSTTTTASAMLFLNRAFKSKGVL